MGIGAENVMGAAHHMLEKLFAPEIWAYNWMSGKVHGVFGHADKVPEAPPTDYHNLPANEYRFVDYYAEACPHCVDLAPKWKAAAAQWENMQHDKNIHVVFEQKQCLDGSWKPGPDYAACSSENVHAFPTLKFFGPKGAETPFEGARTDDQMIKFVQQQTGELPMPVKEEGVPAEGIPTDHAIPAANTMVEYYAAGCPHCVKLKPVWEDAASSWAKDHKEDVQWTAKECLNAQWKPGKDFEDCIKEEVQAFPTVRFESKTGVVHEFEGDRSVDAMHKFAEKEVEDLPAEEAPAAAEEPAVKVVDVVDDKAAPSASAAHDQETAHDQEMDAKMAGMMDPRILVAGMSLLGASTSSALAYTSRNDVRQTGTNFL